MRACSYVCLYACTQLPARIRRFNRRRPMPGHPRHSLVPLRDQGRQQRGELLAHLQDRLCGMVRGARGFALHAAPVALCHVQLLQLRITPRSQITVVPPRHLLNGASASPAATSAPNSHVSTTLTCQHVRLLHLLDLRLHLLAVQQAQASPDELQGHTEAAVVVEPASMPGDATSTLFSSPRCQAGSSAE